VHHAGLPQPVHFAGSGLPMGQVGGPSVPMGQFAGPPLPGSQVGGPAPPMFYPHASSSTTPIHPTIRSRPNWELEQDHGQIADVQGRLKKSIKFWEETLMAPQSIKEWVLEGYKLPLLTLPPPYYKGNQRSAG